jgi:uncharacterized protein YbjT (DUF2867 family)
MASRAAIVAGATGLVGSAILQCLIGDPGVAEAHVLGRRAPSAGGPKVTAHVVDFAKLPALPPADELYLALGTTIRDAGSQEAFRAIDYDANLAVARAALAAGVKRVGLVSAMGADSGSRVFYSRVKGELEEALAKLPFEGLVIARPSLLEGQRTELGQRSRPGEELGYAVDRLFGFLIPANYKPIAATAVAAALASAVPTARGKRILLSGEMRRAG